ncbi:methionyl-tRNA formyltransferase [bacterium]|nr:MAG: methionyl-tRNA formyltransferase [bacterium]
MGSPDFAVPSLEAVAQSGHEVVAVISGEDKRRGRGNELTPTPVKAKALELGLPVFSFESMKNPELEALLSSLQPDLIVIVAFKILPKSILAIPKVGSINVHASLLPKYRGAAPIHWSVVHGDEETGVSLFFLNEQVDAGSIILQKKTPISLDDTTGEVYARLMQLGAEAVQEVLPLIESGNYQTIQQNEALATPAPKVFPEDAKIDFNQDVEKIHNRIRGMNPFPGSWCLLDGKKLKLKRSSISYQTGLSVGELGFINQRLGVGCVNGILWLDEVQLEGKASTDGASFWNGYKGDKTLS